MPAVIAGDRGFGNWKLGLIAGPGAGAKVPSPDEAQASVRHWTCLRIMVSNMRNTALLAFAVWVSSPASHASTNLSPSPIKQFWGGGRQTMALLTDASVWTWGSDVSGKLGDGQVSPSYNVTNNDSFMPIRVHGPGNVGYLTSVVAISDRKSTRLNSSHLGISYA